MLGLGRRQQSQQTSAERTVGLDQLALELIRGLEGKQILVTLVNGKEPTGCLIGADPYNRVVRRADGVELMINKGQMLYLCAIDDPR